MKKIFSMIVMSLVVYSVAFAAGTTGTAGTADVKTKTEVIKAPVQTNVTSATKPVVKKKVVKHKKTVKPVKPVQKANTSAKAK
jgi:hypothetical protein